MSCSANVSMTPSRTGEVRLRVNASEASRPTVRFRSASERFETYGDRRPSSRAARRMRSRVSGWTAPWPDRALDTVFDPLVTGCLGFAHGNFWKRIPNPSLVAIDCR